MPHSILGSIYSTLAVAIERYMSVCHPHFTPSHCAGSFSIAGLVIFSIAFNVCRFLEFETTYDYKARLKKSHTVTIMSGN